MKNISTGTGIALLAGAIVAYPIIDRVMPRADAGAADTAIIAAVSATTENCGGSDDVWFSPLPHFMPTFCGGIAVTAQDINASDVNNDGSVEYFSSPGQLELISQGGVGQYADILRTRLGRNGETTIVTGTRVFDGFAVGSAIRASYPQCSAFTGYLTNFVPYFGWRDCDDDGDLDLVVFYTAVGLPASLPASGQCWFENIGFQQQLQIVGDLNADGKVNGADLGTLLVNWTP
jgi:hypothetical protein